MGLIKEPEGVDFYVKPQKLTQKEKEAISKYIREYKSQLIKKKGNALVRQKD